jgi:hypothetical protein
MVERALDAYEISRKQVANPHPPSTCAFANAYGSDIDLEALIRESGEIDPVPEL